MVMAPRVTDFSFRHVAPSRNAWKLCDDVRMDTLGPLGSLRVKVLWLTLHQECVALTEAPMICKKWKLFDFSSDGLILQRTNTFPGDTRDLMLVRPNIPRTLVQVTCEEDAGISGKMLVECNLVSGKTIYKEIVKKDSTWSDLALKVWLKDNSMWNVNFVKDNMMVPRSFFRHPVVESVPSLQDELKQMEVKELAISGPLGAFLMDKHEKMKEKMEKMKEKMEKVKAKMAKMPKMSRKVKKAAVFKKPARK